jgi:hypothetical protein
MSSFPPICGLSFSSIGGVGKKRKKLNLDVRNNSQGHILSTTGDALRVDHMVREVLIQSETITKDYGLQLTEYTLNRSSAIN